MEMANFLLFLGKKIGFLKLTESNLDFIDEKLIFEGSFNFNVINQDKFHTFLQKRPQGAPGYQKRPPKVRFWDPFGYDFGVFCLIYVLYFLCLYMSGLSLHKFIYI